MIRPKEPTDLLLAPVAAAIDRNLRRLREQTPAAIEVELQLELDAPLVEHTRAERAERILRVATRDVELHGWTPSINADASAVHLEGGSVSLDLALSPTVRRYVEVGPADA